MTPRGTHRLANAAPTIAEASARDDVVRAVSAIYASSPGFLIKALSTDEQLEGMLNGLARRMGGRALADISSSELRAIARASIEEAHDLGSASAPEPGFPAPVLTGEADAVAALRAVEHVLAQWRDDVTNRDGVALEALARVREIVESTPSR